MRVLVTGADGFIGKNLLQHLSERSDVIVVKFTKKNLPSELPRLLEGIDCVFHLAGVNRPQNVDEFVTGNASLTQILSDAIGRSKGPIPFILTSSIQASSGNPYGESKLAAEKIVLEAASKGIVVPYIFRLPNVFGKWCKPNYNSAVATFCYNSAHGLPLTINDRNAPLKLAYIDDVVSKFLDIIDNPGLGREVYQNVEPVYETSVGAVADAVLSFHADRLSLKVKQVGTGLLRALYATYISYLDADQFSYTVPSHSDDRGRFVEMLKTETSGQWSFFTAKPGITRGGHYHHTKSEKFLVVKGRARFCFRNVLTDETQEIFTSGDEAQVVDTAPGWAHDITNVGEDEMIVMLWANEVFDREHPDTFARKL